MSDYKNTSLRRARVKKTPALLILGYTRTGKAVVRPTSEGDADLDDWTRGDHADAAHILKEHSDREPDRTIAAWCKHRGRAHKVLGGR